MKHKIIHTGSIFIIITAVLVFLVGYAVDNEAERLEDLGYIGTASISFEYGISPKETFANFPIREGWYVEDLLNTLSSEKNIGIVSKSFGEDIGLFIESINGVGQDESDGKWWQFWVNGEYSNQGVSNTPVHDGDFIEFKYTDNRYE